MKNPKYRILRIVIIALVIVAVADLACTFAYWRFCEKALPVAHEGVDACIVLFGDFDGKQPGPETLRRVNRAMDLMKNGAVKSIICVGGARTSRNLYGAESVKAYAMEKGIDPERVYSERVSNDTLSNMSEVFRIMTENGMTSAVVISSPVHLFRTRRWVQAPEGFDISYLPYGDEATPELTLRDRVHAVHHEWLAFAARAVLPTDKYSNLLDGVRK